MAWFRAHASALFLVVCLIAGLVCIVWGQSLDQAQAIQKLWSNVLTSLGGSVFAFSLTAAFFNIGDMRAFMEERLAQLFAQPEIIRTFAQAKRREISRIAVEGCLPKVAAVPVDLYDFIYGKQLDYLSRPIAENYMYSAVIRPGPSPQWVVNHYTLRYRLVVSHLKANERKVRFKFEFAWKSPLGSDDIDWIPEFELRVGAQTFSRDDLKFSKKEAGGALEHHAIFQEQIDVHADTYVSFVSKAVGSISENIDVCKLTFPTKGVRAELTYEPGFMYDAMVFKCDSSGESMNSEEVTYRDNCISICTDSWLLPGNGVAISFRKPA